MDTTNSETPQQYGARLRQARERRGLLQRELASRAGVSLRTLIRLEQGYPCKGLTVERVIAALGKVPELAEQKS